MPKPDIEPLILAKRALHEAEQAEMHGRIHEAAAHMKTVIDNSLKFWKSLSLKAAEGGRES